MLCRLAGIDAPEVAKPPEHDVPQLGQILCIADDIRIGEVHTVDAGAALRLCELLQDLIVKDDLRLAVANLFEDLLQSPLCHLVTDAVDRSGFAEIDLHVEACVDVCEDFGIIDEVEVRAAVAVIVADDTIDSDLAGDVRPAIDKDSDHVRTVAVLVKIADS